jgi:hypothetical protein
VTPDILTKVKMTNPSRSLFYYIPSELRKSLSILAQVKHNEGWNKAGSTEWWAMVAAWNKCHDYIKPGKQDRGRSPSLSFEGFALDQEPQIPQIQQQKSQGSSNKNNKNDTKSKKEALRAKKTNSKKKNNVRKAKKINISSKNKDDPSTDSSNIDENEMNETDNTYSKIEAQGAALRAEKTVNNEKNRELISISDEGTDENSFPKDKVSDKIIEESPSKKDKLSSSGERKNVKDVIGNEHSILSKAVEEHALPDVEDSSIKNGEISAKDGLLLSNQILNDIEKLGDEICVLSTKSNIDIACTCKEHLQSIKNFLNGLQVEKIYFNEAFDCYFENSIQIENLADQIDELSSKLETHKQFNLATCKDQLLAVKEFLEKNLYQSPGEEVSFVSNEAQSTALSAENRSINEAQSAMLRAKEVRMGCTDGGNGDEEKTNKALHANKNIEALIRAKPETKPRAKTRALPRHHERSKAQIRKISDDDIDVNEVELLDIYKTVENQVVDDTTGNREKTWEIKYLENISLNFYIIKYDEKEILFPMTTLTTLLGKSSLGYVQTVFTNID